MTATLTPLHAGAAEERANPAEARGRRWASIRTPTIVLGLMAAVMSFAGSWNPSFWGDEAASVMSAERPISTLFPMLGRIDAVHGLYYLFLHGWINLFGASELSVRLPSAIGVGIAAAGTVTLAALLFDRRIAVIAGLVFAVLPRVTYMGAEARSYALGTAIAVWLTVLLVVLVRQHTVRRRSWLLYSLGFALAVYCFLYMILLAIVHAIVVLTMTRRRNIQRGWLGAASLGVALALPIVAFALGQHGQISFLGTRPKFSPQLVFVSQWFGRGWIAALCWLLIATAVVVTVRTWRKSATHTLPTGTILALSWLVLPTLLLELGNVFVAPMYTTRYLSFCTPAVAILIAVGIAVFARNWMRVAVVGILLGLVAPVYLAQRGPYAKNGGSDWRQASAVLGLHAHSGDAIVFGEATKPSQKPRLAMHLYPADYIGLEDVALVAPYAQTGSLWDVAAPLERVAGRLVGTNTVWAMEMKPRGTSQPSDVLELERLGYRLQHTYPMHRTVVYELSKSRS